MTGDTKSVGFVSDWPKKEMGAGEGEADDIFIDVYFAFFLSRYTMTEKRRTYVLIEGNEFLLGK